MCVDVAVVAVVDVVAIFVADVAVVAVVAVVDVDVVAPKSYGCFFFGFNNSSYCCGCCC